MKLLSVPVLHTDVHHVTKDEQNTINQLHPEHLRKSPPSAPGEEEAGEETQVCLSQIRT